MLLPERISEFAAHMACYIWFSDYQQQPSNNTNSNSNSIIDVQSSSNWSLSLEIPPGGSYVNCQRFNEYKPKDPFKKFCLDVLATTQISFPAVLLSLLYIHRMKIRNPKIKATSTYSYNNPSQPTIEIGSTSYNNYFGNLLLPLTTATVV
ncbi:22506_t:CDS:2 [Entrophospora sp. SA101]|nr:22506_t:CDS:2 [Entrophospora sp. SA101]